MTSKQALAKSIVKTLRSKRHEAYYVGGCVRDMILGKKPSDFDIASDATPNQIRRYFKKTIPVGEAFGVMIVRLKGQSFEVSTFRRESDYRDGRRPEKVEFTDARSDVLRRDFTVNGLYFDPITKKSLDWIGGTKDIRKRVIRTIGNPEKRFHEDKLRMLRAVRFAVCLNFKIEPRTSKAIRKMRSQILVVSRERIRDELVKIFTGPHPAKGLDLLDKTGLLEIILPEIYRLKGVQQPRKFHPEGDVYRHTRLIMGLLKKPSIVLAFGCLLHDIGKPKTFHRSKDRIRFNGHDKVGAKMAERLLDRLRFSNADKNQIVACVDGHMRFKDTRQMKESTLRKMFQRETFLTELEQHRLDCLASHKDLSIWRFLNKKLKRLSKGEIKPKPYLMGRDLLALGFKAGPEMGKILRLAEDKQLEGEFKIKEEAFDWARKLKLKIDC